MTKPETRNTVYLIGAGINQPVRDWDNLSPPTIGNLFQLGSKSRKFSDKHYIKKIQPVFDFIQKYWRRTPAELADSPFNLEECFSLLDVQIDKILNRMLTFDEEEPEELGQLGEVQFRLQSFLAEFLSDFEPFAATSTVFRDLGRLILREKPTIMTFNYDTFLEEAIESASGVTENLPPEFVKFMQERPSHGTIPDTLLAYSHYKWNRPLAYGIEFDEVQLQQAGVPSFIDGSRFYGRPENQLYSPPVLKMHGSLNWFRYTPHRRFPEVGKKKSLGDRASQLLLVTGHWWFNEPPEHRGWYIDPVIITPVVYKNKFFEEGPDNPGPFTHIWSMARDALSRCERLVTIGYSFSPADFSTRQLLLESFSGHELKELVVANPNPEVARTVRNLCHFDAGVEWYRGVEDYVKARCDTLGIGESFSTRDLRS